MNLDSYFLLITIFLLTGLLSALLYRCRLLRIQNRELNQRLSSKVIDDKKFIRSVCHDLANPIMIISSYLTMIKSGKIPPAKVQETLEKIQNNADSALTVINEIKVEAKDNKNL